MKPYYEHAGITIYCGDARHLGWLSAESIITDPVWPNSVFPGIDPKETLRETLADGKFPGVERVAVHLGCDSDPRFLEAVPIRWPFFRVCWLDYARPSYKGRLLYGSDVAYLFGDPPASAPGRQLIPGKCMAQRTGYKVQHEIGSSYTGKSFTQTAEEGQRAHPCPRRIQHVQWLVKHWSRESVLDPFMGAGTTALACKSAGVKFIGIEIEERYVEIAIRRLEQEVLPFEHEEQRTAVQSSLLAKMEDEEQSTEDAPLLYMSNEFLPARAAKKMR